MPRSRCEDGDYMEDAKGNAEPEREPTTAGDVVRGLFDIFTLGMFSKSKSSDDSSSGSDSYDHSADNT